MRGSAIDPVANARRSAFAYDTIHGHLFRASLAHLVVLPNLPWGSVRTVHALASTKMLLHLVTQQTHTVDAALELALVVTFVIGAALLLHFGGGMTTETIMSGGMMGRFASLSGEK